MGNTSFGNLGSVQIGVFIGLIFGMVCLYFIYYCIVRKFYKCCKARCGCQRNLIDFSTDDNAHNNILRLYGSLDDLKELQREVTRDKKTMERKYEKDFSKNRIMYKQETYDNFRAVLDQRDFLLTQYINAWSEEDVEARRKNHSLFKGDLLSYNMLRNDKYQEIQALVQILDKLEDGDGTKD